MDLLRRMRREKGGSSGEVAGPSVFLSSADEDVTELVELPQGFQGPSRGSGGKVGFLTRYRRRKTQLALSEESPGSSRVAAGSLELRRGPQGPTYGATERSSLHASREGPLWIPLQSLPGPRSYLELRQEPRGSSPGSTGISGFFWGVHFGVRAFSRVEPCKSDL